MNDRVCYFVCVCLCSRASVTIAQESDNLTQFLVSGKCVGAKKPPPPYRHSCSPRAIKVSMRCDNNHNYAGGSECWLGLCVEVRLMLIYVANESCSIIFPVFEVALRD